MQDTPMLLNPGPQLIERMQLVPAATVEPLCDPEQVEKPQVDVIHRSVSIGSSERSLEIYASSIVSSKSLSVRRSCTRSSASASRSVLEVETA
jgi:hypothetical protein